MQTLKVNTLFSLSMMNNNELLNNKNNNCLFSFIQNTLYKHSPGKCVTSILNLYLNIHAKGFANKRQNDFEKLFHCICYKY